MRKKKEKHDAPVYTKNTYNNTKNKKNSKGHRSRSKHSIFHYHESKINEFTNDKKKIKAIETEINKLKIDLSNSGSAEKEKNVIHIKIKKLQNELDTYNKKEVDYLLQTSEIILKYIELDEKEKKNISNHDNDDNKLFEIYKEKISLTNEYMQIVDPNYNFNYGTTENDICKEDIICLKCNILLDTDNGFYVCHSCGFCKIGLEQSREPSYKELQDYIYKPQFTYQKETHLDDWLRRFQSKENRIIEQSILDKVILEARKQRITDLNLLTEEKVKTFLKKLNLNDYYDNVIAIINRINGRPPFQLTVEIENKIKTMFRQIQEPFIKHKPPSRKNFLSYAYILYQFFKILGLNEFAKYFPLLKSADKLRQQDEIFKKIVADMAEVDKSINWVFYPTI
jgi:hypothetical protein